MNAPPKAFETPGPKPGMRADAIDWKARAETAEGLLANTNKILQEAFGDHSLLAKILEVTNRAEKAERELAEAIEALSGTWSVLNAAGTLNLSNGVQLGQTSWYVKIEDQRIIAAAIIAKATK